MYIADIFNNRIRKVDTNGIISTVAGGGASNYYVNGGAATNTGLSLPASVAVDNRGNIYIAELVFPRIRRVDTNGIINTVVGTNGTGFSGDSGMAVNASLTSPQGVALDIVGNYYIADTGNGNGRIRKVDTNGIITTVAGGGGKIPGDGGAAISARFGEAWGVVLDPSGNLYFADESYDMVRKVDTNGIITTVVGKMFSARYSGDGGVATNATVNGPASVALDATGNLFIADWYNNRIRKVQLVSSPTLVLPNVTATNIGNYSVVITNSSGSITSSVVALNVQLPPITPTFISSNGICQFTWSAVSNRLYQLQFTTNLTAPVWVNAGNPITATNSSVTTTDVIIPDAERYYRVCLLP